MAKIVPPGIEIARQAKMLPIEKIAARLNIPIEHLDHYGRYKAKVSLGFFQQLEKAEPGKLILVTAITPTPAGEGKTTTTIGLADALNRLGRRAAICLREPSVGPCFGVKGGGTGGGYAQVVPMEDINLHFTGDFQVISTAHNLLTAMLDNHLHHGNALGINPERIVWKRVMDMNDRALRQIVSVWAARPTVSATRVASTLLPPPKSWLFSPSPNPWLNSANGLAESSSPTRAANSLSPAPNSRPMAR